MHVVEGLRFGCRHSCALGQVTVLVYSTHALFPPARTDGRTLLTSEGWAWSLGTALLPNSVAWEATDPRGIVPFLLLPLAERTGKSGIPHLPAPTLLAVSSDFLSPGAIEGQTGNHDLFPLLQGERQSKF